MSSIDLLVEGLEGLERLGIESGSLALESVLLKAVTLPHKSCGTILL